MCANTTLVLDLWIRAWDTKLCERPTKKMAYGMGLMKKSMQYEIVCKSTTNKIAYGMGLMNMSMRYKLLCKIPTKKVAYVRQPHKSELW